MRERHERCHGPYRVGLQFRVIFVGADGSRDSRYFESEREALDVAAAYRKNAETRTIQVAVNAYLASQAKRVAEGEIQASTVEREGYHLVAMLKLDDNGMLDLKRLNAKMAMRLYDERSGAVDTHRNGLSVCKAFGKWCVDRGWLATNPFGGIKGRGRRKKGKPQLRADEARRFLGKCVELAPTDDGAVCALAYLVLGARAGEVVLREVRDVDDDGRLFWIPDSKTAAGRRQLEVPDVLREHFMRLCYGRKPDEPLFAHAVTRARPQDWAREQVWRMCKLAGVPEVTPHGLRGTNATIGYVHSSNAENVAAALGHASTGITTGGAYIDKREAEKAARRRTWKVLDGDKTGT